MKKAFPVAVKIKFKSNNFAESNIIRRAELVLFNKNQTMPQQISKLREEITECKRKIQNSINNKTFLHQVDGFVFNSKGKVFKTTKGNQV